MIRKASLNDSAARIICFFLVVTLWASVLPLSVEAAQNPAVAGSARLQAAAKKILALDSAHKLLNTDCIKCHTSEPADIKRAGGKHRTAVTCLDCHIQHLPSGVKTIPQCSMCHDPSAQAHFALGTRSVCLKCHRNPHTPLVITIPNKHWVNKACETCHPEKGKEFKEYPSKHSQKNCTFCHPKKHKRIKRCLQCHKPHAPFMVFKDCLRCHKPHSPLNIHYAGNIPNKYCGACHTDIFKLLSKSKAKHGKFKCAFCHKNKHPTVPKCQDCHQNIHSESILSRFNNNCLKCHRDPHNLLI
ncbi:diguanylate cyclase/phosphodiesterase (GGDEF & EAL domains) with PAS/PAC sensor(s) [hydrothermal vent metagenome]|uniref:Diguanylate cyclase/phosphodiesterase (GGDEF & EAL domains) with PAS/PAC sensor(S) n=1 Tax=hydrothermal vent metagenome TaxID=652676 RepID=A0A3B0VAJ8_9ZZZZ